MAKATAKKSATYTLTLSQEEAEVVQALLGKTSAVSNVSASPKKHANAVCTALRVAGVDSYENPVLALMQPRSFGEIGVSFKNYEQKVTV